MRAGQGRKGMKYKGTGSRAGKDVSTPVQFLVQVIVYTVFLTEKHHRSKREPLQIKVLFKQNSFLVLKTNSPAHLKSEYNDLQQLKIWTWQLFLNANTSR